MRNLTFLLAAFLMPVLMPVLVQTADAQTKLYDLLPPVPLDGGHFGVAATSVGDRNNDGVTDFAITGGTRVNVFSGVDGDLLLTLNPPADSGVFGGASIGKPLALINNSNPMFVVGAPIAGGGVGRAFAYNAAGLLAFEFDSPGGEGFGFSVADAGDPDGDGYNDVAVGAFQGTGRVYFFDTFSGNLTDSLSSPVPLDGSRFGLDLVNLRDINGDGVDDFAVSAPQDAAPAVEGAGKVYVYSGATREFVYGLSSPNAEVDGNFGVAIANVGDMNADGRDDLAVAAIGESAGASEAGRVYIFSGYDGTPLFDLVSPLAELRGLFGWALAGLGDTNGDELPDIAVGAPYEDGGVGRVYVFGGDERLIATLSPTEGDSVLFGISVVGIGDVNGDGRSDLLVAAPLDNIGAINAAGTASVWSMPSIVATEDAPAMVEASGLADAYPNPFRGLTTIRYELSAPTAVHLAVYDVLGRHVSTLRNGVDPAGLHEATFDGSGLAAGPYVVVLDADGSRTALLLTRYD